MKTKWLRRALLKSFNYCLAIDEKGFRKVLKEIKLPRNEWPEFMPYSAAAVTNFLTDSEGSNLIVVCYQHKKSYSAATIAGILAHEAVHVWQHTRDAIGEKSPSSEQEAYAIQNITRELMDSFQRQRKAKKHGK